MGTVEQNMNYFKQIRGAVQERKLVDMPKTGWLIIAITLFTLLYCIFSVFAVPSTKSPDFNFQEDGAVTALSSIFLTLACGSSTYELTCPGEIGDFNLTSSRASR